MNLLLQTAGRLVRPLMGTGIGKLPGVTPAYKMLWRMLGPRGEVLTSANGYKLYIDCRDWAIAPSLIFSHVWEPVETAIIKKNLLPGMTFVDVGAHVGYYSLLASQLVGTAGKVFAFEPNPHTLLLLARNILLNKSLNIETVPFAALDTSGEKVYIYMDHSPASSSLYGDGDTSSLILTKSLDDVVEQADFVKVDAEGSETRILQGMQGLIQRSPNLKLLTEFYPVGLEKAGTSYMEYLAALQEYFTVYRIGRTGELLPTSEQDIRETTDRAGAINVLCIRRRSS